jgi:hypothetical protein
VKAEPRSKTRTGNVQIRIIKKGNRKKLPRRPPVAGYAVIEEKKAKC